jgi:hypothetical protein
MLFSYRVGVPTQEADNFELVIRCNFILTKHVTITRLIRSDGGSHSGSPKGLAGCRWAGTFG